MESGFGLKGGSSLGCVERGSARQVGREKLLVAAGASISSTRSPPSFAGISVAKNLTSFS